MKRVLALIVLAALSAARAESIAELLQKAIYTQETLGDLDGAIRIYRRILTQAKDSRAYAAQAQYRLGACLIEKGQRAEGQALLEQVIKDYPELKELVAKARELVPGELKLEPEPWVDGEVLQLTIRLPTGLEIGALIWTAEAGETRGRPVWRLGWRRYVPGSSGISRVVADRETLRPLTSFFRHSLLGQSEFEYLNGSVIVRVKGKPDETRPLNGLAYDNEEAMHLVRRLSLAVGFKIELPILPPLGGSLVKVGLEVTARETVQTPAGKFDCFRVEFSINKNTFWVSADPNRYIVKFEGEGVTAELSNIGRMNPFNPVEYRDHAGAFAVKAPARWLFVPNKLDNEVHLLDPEGIATATVFRVEAVDPTSPTKDVRQEIEERLARRTQTLKDFKPRPESWKPLAVAGKTGFGIVADYKDGEENMVEYHGWVRDNHRRVIVRSRLEANDLPTFQDELESILLSYSDR